MSNRTDIVVETDNAEGQVLLSASRVYDLTEYKTQDTINSEVRNTLNQLDQNMAYVESGNTASRTYAAGAYISWKGTLYTASASIPLGDPFAIGTNLSAVVDGTGAPCGGLNSIETKFSGIGFIGNSVLYSKGWFDSTAVNYTATADGFIYGEICSYNSNYGMYAAVDGIRIGYNCSSNTISSFTAPIKRGQTITAGSGSVDAKIEVKIYNMEGR